MMWLRCCCCCFCCGTDTEEEKRHTTLDDSSSLIVQEGQQIHHPFYVPRRHSSFQPSTRNPAFVESGRAHSDGSSSSDEERVPEQRARFWSTVPVSDVTAFVASQQGHNRLKVFLKQAAGLPKKGEDPYGTFVKTSLTSSGKNFRMSRAAKKTFSPVYGEEHLFHVSRSKWKSTSPTAHLRLSVFDCDRQGRHDAIGHVLLPLHQVGQDLREHCMPLTPMSLPVKNLGQILVGLLYAPTQSRLSIHVIKARHLRLDAEAHKRHLRPLNKELLDSFCKVTLTCGGQKVKTCRSRCSSGPDPFFDFRTGFVVPPQYLHDAGTVVSVVARSTLGREGATLGRAAVLGPYLETGDGCVTQWGRMIHEGRSVVQWRNLYL